MIKVKAAIKYSVYVLILLVLLFILFHKTTLGYLEKRKNAEMQEQLSELTQQVKDVNERMLEITPILKAAQERNSTLAAINKMDEAIGTKKQELATIQEEMTRGQNTLEELTVALERERSKGWWKRTFSDSEANKIKKKMIVEKNNQEKLQNRADEIRFNIETTNREKIELEKRAAHLNSKKESLLVSAGVQGVNVESLYEQLKRHHSALNERLNVINIKRQQSSITGRTMLYLLTAFMVLLFLGWVDFCFYSPFPLILKDKGWTFFGESRSGIFFRPLGDVGMTFLSCVVVTVLVAGAFLILFGKLLEAAGYASRRASEDDN